jgi:imidazolonepropionase-like amidohydrolase
MKALLTFVFAITLVALKAQIPYYAFTNVHLFDGVENNIKKDVIVFVANGKIERIGKAGNPIPKLYQVIDGEGKYLMPGMMDVHTHLDNMAAARRALETGVTTVRSASVPGFQDVALANLVKNGQLPGPDMIACGIYVTPNLGETILADTRLAPLLKGVQTDDELRLLVNVNIDRGARVIKTRGTERAGLPDTDPRQQTYTTAQLRVIVDEAAKRQVPVMVHAHGDEGARAAVAAGARSIEHGTFLSEQTLQLMKEKGTYLVPTFSTLEDLTLPGGDYDGPVLHLRGKFMMPMAEKVVKRAHALGIPIATGVDNNYTPASTTRVAHECAHFVRMGMTPFEAIRCATTTAATLLGIEKSTGQIAPGFEADLILVAGNPLEDIVVLQDVLLVMSNGQLALKRIPFGKN